VPRFTVVILGRFSVFRTRMDDKSNDYCGSNIAVTCIMKSALRTDRLSLSLSLARSLLIDPSASEDTESLSDTVRSQKPPVKFTRALAGVYSRTISVQARAVSTRGSSSRIRRAESRRDGPSELSEPETRDERSFSFSAISCREKYRASDERALRNRFIDLNGHPFVAL